jgi:hypothetical protein
METRESLPQQVLLAQEVTEAKLPEALPPPLNITVETCDYYFNRMKQLEVALTKEQILITVEIAHKKFDLFEERDYPFFGKIKNVSGLSIAQGFGLISGYPGDSLAQFCLVQNFYIAIVKNRLIQGLAWSHYDKKFLEFFMRANPDWFKQGDKFTEITRNFL